MITIGLTGGIGMGKSTVAGIFRRLGVPVFDADAAVHRAQAPGGAAIPAIAATFAGTVTAGVLDRARLRAIVLADPAALRRLERIMHPLVRARRRAFRIAARRAGRRVTVLDIPLLFESGADADVDVSVTVSCKWPIQIARVRRRRRMTMEEIAALIAKQMPDAEKRARADFIIDTGLSRHFTFLQTHALLRMLVQ